MDILMACPELSPIVKVGELAEAVAALSKTLSRLEHKVTVAIPRYPAVEGAGLMLARRLTPIRFEAAGKKIEATLFDARLGSGVELVLIDLPGVFEGDAIYTGDDRDGERFGLFCRALAELVAMRSKARAPFDAVHAHDWQTALLPYLLKAARKGGGASPRTVLTIHDATRQGRCDKSVVDAIGLAWEDFHPAGLEFYGDLNLLKAGVLSADVVTAISPTYAAEIQTPAGGAGLDGVFRMRTADLTGICNGIDYSRWSPSTDPHVPAHYDAESADAKARCKAALLHELDMPLDLGRPLVVAVGPIDEQRGTDVLVAAMPGIVRAGARLVVAGSGDAELVALCEDAAQSAADDVAFLGAPSEPMLHRLIGAADLALFTSRHEPCGLLQQCAQRYGALPIAHAVGGFRDTIVDCDAALETGTGFLYEELGAEAVVGAVQRALAAMTRPAWPALRRRVMRLDRSWELPGRRYARLYQRPANPT
jgi:starch synthase